MGVVVMMKTMLSTITMMMKMNTMMKKNIMTVMSRNDFPCKLCDWYL